MASEEHGHSPLSQFEIHPLIDLPRLAGFDISFTNSSAYMVLTVLAALTFMSGGIRSRSLVPSRWQSMAELVYEFVANMIRENVGSEGRKYFPAIFTLFLFVLFGNLWGMIPGSFTITSHFIVTFALAIVMFIGVTVLGVVRHGVKFAGFFLPTGTPLFLAPLMIPIEILSYLSRPISLSMRLGANMMIGHMLMKVVAGFVLMGGLALGWLPFGFLVIFTGFEIFIALLHAYIFTVLTCVYLNDALHLH